MRYTYFVHYNYTTNHGTRGSGNSSMIVDREIDSYDVIQSIQDTIKQNRGYSIAIITNYILMSKEGVNE